MLSLYARDWVQGLETRLLRHSFGEGAYSWQQQLTFTSNYGLASTVTTSKVLNFTTDVPTNGDLNFTSDVTTHKCLNFTSDH